MIDTVLFDMGGTLEDIVNTPETLERATQAVVDKLKRHGLDPTRSADEMTVMLKEGLDRYSRQRDKNHIELKPVAIWQDFMLKDAGLDPQKLAEIAEELAHEWEVTYFNRSLRPGVKKMLQGLQALGLKLGIISNTASLFQVFSQLELYGIREFFSDVTLSSQICCRKPHPDIFKIALLQMRSEAERSIYVGDTLSRDVLGARNAGFAYAIQITSQITKEKDAAMKNAPTPDYKVQDIGDVLGICQTLLQA